ncbi:FAD-dependent oxidoreductase [Frankia sp. AgB1.9]|uniref:NAD(P)/FAD-dependent oxidoreductase n=1 Tax=unclassified Frankia TaxID=2632575 RepID=UPI00193405F0|nr:MULTISPECIES: FAD-dependent oxidoreductase [unclassified Frankia]MBL7493522.1 FAD-dependent oxidoreductase [Frankia sp. AgW1.1]MBL7552737.1 FAD-dependent oxidoreductase [Frankia sp. AgB1.9]MBL7624644.1 FAD-dependent oxidoreductase [Frankia sp. AgB1.8]
MSEQDTIVIVGGSVAGLRTAEALRRHSFGGAITIVEAGRELPHDRPALSKQLLATDAPPESVLLRTAAQIAARDIDLRRGTAATGLDPAGRTVQLAGGERLAFDQAVIATGVAPRRLPVPAPTGGVHYLRDLPDALALRAAIGDARQVAVIGGGFIGLEVASVLAGRVEGVTVIEAMPSPLAHLLGETVARRVVDLHRAQGVQFALGRTVTRILGTDRPSGVVLDGSIIPADLVVVGVGAVPNTGWLAGSGLAVDGGVVCDEHLRTSAAGVHAVGDVARWPNARYGQTMRIEHWTNAIEQAGVVGWNLLNPRAPRAYTPVPYVWSDQYDTRLQIIGRPGPADTLMILEDDPGARRFVAAYLRADAVVGGFAMNAPSQALALRRAITAGLSPTEALAAAGSALEAAAFSGLASPPSRPGADPTAPTGLTP